MVTYYFRILTKKLRLGYVSSAGRNFSGTICVRHRSGGHKRSCYKIDFVRRLNCYGYVFKILKTPFYTSFIGLVIYDNGISTYSLLGNNQQLYEKIYSGTGISNHQVKGLGPGSSISLKFIDLFNIVSNLELSPYSGGSLMRAAGTMGLITMKVDNKVLLKLKSGWNILLNKNCISMLGRMSNIQYRYKRLKNAGYVRSLGIRPTVRGVAMNPCDHPHGGGEGKKSGSLAARSPWGWLTKGTPSVIKKSRLLYKKKFKFQPIS